MNRRRLLRSCGVAGVAATAGCVGSVAPRGVITFRAVLGRVGDPERDRYTDEVEIFHDEVCDPERGVGSARVHEEYADAVTLDSPVTIPGSLHDRLTEEFDELRYHVRHRCDLVGDGEGCSTPRVTRADFNAAALGRTARLLYRNGAWASVVTTSDGVGPVEYVDDCT